MRRVGALGWLLLLLLPTIVASAQSKEEPQKFLRVAASDQPWAVQINESGFVIEAEDVNPCGASVAAYLQAHNDQLGISMLIVKLKRQSRHGQTGMDGCRDWLASERTRISSITSGKATNLSSREIKGVPVFEYSLNVMGLESQVLLACMAKDQFHVELTMSKENFKPNDERLFASILDATQIVKAEPSSSSCSSSVGKPETKAVAQPQVEAPQQQPASPLQDLYRSSFSGNTYHNELFGFSVALPEGWKHADSASLRQYDERQQAQKLDALARKTGRADLIQSGVLKMPHVYTLMMSRSGSTPAKSEEDLPVIIVKAAQRLLPDFFIKGSCADLYFQENEWFRSKDVKSLSKLAHVTYGGRDFSQGDFRFKEEGREHFATVSATCEEKRYREEKYYLVLEFVGNSAAEVKSLSDVAKSIQFIAR